MTRLVTVGRAQGREAAAGGRDENRDCKVEQKQVGDLFQTFVSPASIHTQNQGDDDTSTPRAVCNRCPRGSSNEQVPSRI